MIKNILSGIVAVLRPKGKAKADNPYRSLPPEKFWRNTVAASESATLEHIYKKKFTLRPEDKIATAGSCFAQHIAGNLRKNGYTVADYEPPPPGLTPAHAKEYGYNIYSARYANIYTARHLRQLLAEAWGETTGGDDVWEKDGRYYDPLRPTVEPEGFATAEEVAAYRRYHLSCVKKMVQDMDVFIFTFGLTEAWVEKETGKVYPVCPGTVAGVFDPARHIFKNFTFAEVYEDFLAARAFIKKKNPDVRFIVTVSPVPLVATASDAHVMPATVYSKSVLRAVAGQLAQECEDVDYFPSYDIVTNPWSGNAYYDEDKRSVLPAGVQRVMNVFFSQHAVVAAQVEDGAADADEDDVVCEEALLEAFRP